MSAAPPNDTAAAHEQPDSGAEGLSAAPAGAPAASIAAPGSSPAFAARVWRTLVGAFAAVAVVALLLALLLWFKLEGLQDQLLRQSNGAQTQAAQALALAQQASEVARTAAAREALTRSRVDELGAQRSQVSDLLQSLSYSRDDDLLASIEGVLRLALQQAQVTGHTQPLLSALQTAQQRATRAAAMAETSQARLAPLLRAMQHDADRIRASVSSDNAQVLVRLDQVMRMVDDLPAFSARGATPGSARRDAAAQQRAPNPSSAPGPWWRRWWESAYQETVSLVRVSRIDHPEAALLAPDQALFLRQNIKLKLLNARLAILYGQIDDARADLDAVASLLGRYFDPASRRVREAESVLRSLQQQIKASEAPRLDATLAALAALAIPPASPAVSPAASPGH